LTNFSGSPDHKISRKAFQGSGHEEANSHFSHTTIPKTIKAKIIGEIRKMVISRRDREVCRLFILARKMLHRGLVF